MACWGEVWSMQLFSCDPAPGFLGASSMSLLGSVCSARLARLGLLGSVKVAKILREQGWSGAPLSFKCTNRCSAPCHVDYVVNAFSDFAAASTALCSTLLSIWDFLLLCFSPGSRVDMLLLDTNCTTMYLTCTNDTFKLPAVSLAAKCGEKSFPDR